MDKQSPKIWSHWTNGPQPIWSPYISIPTACPPGQMEWSRDHLSMVTASVGDCLSIGTNQWGTNQLETKCGGPNVRGLYGFGTKCVTANKAFIRCFHQFVSRIYSAYFSQFEQLKKNFFLDQLFFLSLSVEKEIIMSIC